MNFRRAALCGVIAAATLASSHRLAAAAEPPPSEPVVTVDGEPCVAASSLARLLNATRFWRSDVRKLVLRSGAHRVVLTVDNPFVMIDDHTFRLSSPVRMVGGELQVPVAIAAALPRDSTIARLVFEPRGRSLVVVPPGGVIASPRVVQSEGSVRINFTCENPEAAKVVGRSRAYFRIRLDGLFAGLLPDSMPPPALLRTIREIPDAMGSAFEFSLSPEVSGWRLTRAGDRVTLEIVKRAGAGFESFAAEGPPGPRSLRVIVLDPGHGGEDRGVVAGATLEKDLALRLAGALAPELERRTGARVYSTRQTDMKVSPDQRAEAANRVHADLVISLHFDGVPGTRTRGVTAYCPPAILGAREPPAPRGSSTPVEILPWRDVATRHAVRSREIAEALLSTIELRGMGPARLRETLPYPLLGVNAPGMLLECGTLTSPADLARLQSPRGVAELAAAIAEGVDHWLKER